jgi:hypothetical protein
MDRKIYIAMPSRDNPDIDTMFCMAQTMREIERERIKYRYKFSRGSSLIQLTRNQFVADFLASDCTDLVMLDDDLSWEEGAFMRLIKHPVDVVGGVYPKRSDPLCYPVRRLPGGAFDPKTGLMEVELLPTGFLRMTRTCIEAMVAHYKDLAYSDEMVPGGVSHALFWVDLADNIPGPTEKPGLKTVVGEDFSFCRKWRAMGGAVYADTLLRFRHWGKKGFEGCYAETLPVACLVPQAAE